MLRGKVSTLKKYTTKEQTKEKEIKGKKRENDPSWFPSPDEEEEEVAMAPIFLQSSLPITYCQRKDTEIHVA